MNLGDYLRLVFSKALVQGPRKLSNSSENNFSKHVKSRPVSKISHRPVTEAISRIWTWRTWFRQRRNSNARMVPILTRYSPTVCLKKRWRSSVGFSPTLIPFRRSFHRNGWIGFRKNRIFLFVHIFHFQNCSTIFQTFVYFSWSHLHFSILRNFRAFALFWNFLYNF